MQVFRKDSHFATLRADKRALYIQKSFPINLFDKVTARLQTTVASTYDGEPLPAAATLRSPLLLVNDWQATLVPRGSPLLHPLYTFNNQYIQDQSSLQIVTSHEI